MLDVESMVNRIVNGDGRSIARALTILENAQDGSDALCKALRAQRQRAHVVGVTGSAGAGKSSLVDGLIDVVKESGQRVGILAVDPSSPFGGGALLGDRVRMGRHSGDDRVYIRSVGSRSGSGGLSPAVADMLLPLEASGFDVIIVETVGAGQSELDIMHVADTVVLVLTPGAGDAIQTAKSGIMEIADVFAVNKADLAGAMALVHDLEYLLMTGHSTKPSSRGGQLVDKGSDEPGPDVREWCPPIVPTSALLKTGVPQLWEAIREHLRHLDETGGFESKRFDVDVKNVVGRTAEIYKERVEQYLKSHGEWLTQLGREGPTRALALQLLRETTNRDLSSP